MLVKLDHFPKDRGENSKNIWFLTQSIDISTVTLGQPARWRNPAANFFVSLISASSKFMSPIFWYPPPPKKIQNKMSQPFPGRIWDETSFFLHFLQTKINIHKLSGSMTIILRGVKNVSGKPPVEQLPWRRRRIIFKVGRLETCRHIYTHIFYSTVNKYYL